MRIGRGWGQSELFHSEDLIGNVVEWKNGRPDGQAGGPEQPGKKPGRIPGQAGVKNTRQ